MSDQIPGLMGFVVRTLRFEPDVTPTELYQRSLDRYPAVSRMTVRQFHGKYSLQAKKQMNRPEVRLFPLPRSEEAAEALESARPRETTTRASRPAEAPPAAASPGPGTAKRTTGTAGGSSTRSATSFSGRPGSPRPSSGSGRAAAPTSHASEPRMPEIRDALRNVFFRLALELETAQTRKEVVEVVARMDRYVDEALATVRGG